VPSGPLAKLARYIIHAMGDVPGALGELPPAVAEHVGDWLSGHEVVG
jgi:hypothetical protein